VPRRSPSAELLAALATVLRRRHLRWYLFGAQAVVLLGRPRLTEDVDVTVEADAAHLPGLVAALGRAGFVPRVSDVDAFVARARVIPFLHRKTGIPLDMVLAGSGLEQEFLARARMLDVGSVRVPVIAPDDLIISKVIAGRSKDLDDAAGILAAHEDDLDLRRIQGVLGEIDSALGDTDLAACFARMLSQR
jgi:Nucleotidyltransferase of unknown function (DUF6036)